MDPGDRRHIILRHPVLVAGLVLAGVGAAIAFLTFVNWMGRAYPWYGDNFRVELNVSGGTTVFLGVLFVVIAVMLWNRRLGPLPTHLCPACAYDRSGLAPSGPCPECGRAVG